MPVPEDEGQTTVFEGRHSEGISVVVKMTRVFLVQHALQESLAQRQQVRKVVLFAATERKAYGESTQQDKVSTFFAPFSFVCMSQQAKQSRRSNDTYVTSR